MATRKKVAKKKKRVVKSKVTPKKKAPPSDEHRSDRFTLANKKMLRLEGNRLYYSSGLDSFDLKKRRYNTYLEANSAFEELRNSEDPTAACIRLFLQRNS